MSTSDDEAAPTTGEPSAPTAVRPGLLTEAALPMVLAGGLAWAITVAPAGFSRGGSLIGNLLALLSFSAALVGPTLASTRPRLGRHVGITAFVAFATATWLVSSAAIHPLRLDAIRGVFGAVAWGVFALSWSERWSGGKRVLPEVPDAPALQARATLPRFAVPIAVVGVGGALAVLAFAWRAADPERALVSHAVAVGAAVALVSAAAQVATARGRRRSSSGARFTGRAVRALVILFSCALLGAVFLALR